MKQLRFRKGYLLLLGVLVLPAGFFFFRPAAPLETHFYVWQRAWKPELQQALRRAAGAAAGFSLYAGDLQCGEGHTTFSPVDVPWPVLAETHTPVTLVFRARACLDVGNANTPAAIAEAMAGTAGQARAAGVTVAGCQLDYDCPTSKLGSYAELMAGLRKRLKGEILSITTLPTWLPDAHFRDLVRHTGYYVLQVHSFDTPKHIDAPLSICPVDRVPGYLKRAAEFRVPFYLALPTYGYEVVFDARGNFTGLQAEGNARALTPDEQSRELMSNPTELAGLVRQLRAKHPRALRGLIWFRLPVPSDQHNWTWDMLCQVMNGQAPEARCPAKIRTPEPGLYELWVRNDGGAPAGAHLEIELDAALGQCLGSDLLNHFEEVSRTGASLVLRGPAPGPGKDVLAAWLRLDYTTGVQPGVNIRAVEVSP